MSNRNGHRVPMAQVTPKMPGSMMPSNVVRSSLVPACVAYEDLDAGGPPAGSMHLHWRIQAFRAADPDTGALHDVVTISVEAPDEEAALEEAARIIQRPFYRVMSVDESCSLDRELRGHA